MLVLSGSCGGLFIIGKLARRLEFLTGFEAFITSIKSDIRYAAITVSGIAQKYSDGSIFGAYLEYCSNRILNGESFPKAWQNTFLKASRDIDLTSEQKDLIINFGLGLGSSDVEGQLLHCDYYLEQLKPHLTKAREDKKTKGKLYGILGTCLGCVLALLMI